MGNIQIELGELFMGNKHMVYMLHCRDGSLYTGYTTDIERRIMMHETGKGAKYTRGRGPFKLVYKEELSTKTAALQREYEIKKLHRKEKMELIQEQEGTFNEYSNEL